MAEEQTVRLCAFCGLPGKMTREHIFGRWLPALGLGDEPVELLAGPLNRPYTRYKAQAPFTQTVNGICQTCNNGWMSKLEQVAQTALTPAIQGESSVIKHADIAAIVAWAQKTLLVSLLVSSKKARSEGYGIPTEEYRSLFARSNDLQPLPSQFWIGRSAAGRSGGAWGSPLAFVNGGSHQDGLPDGYAITVTIGELLLFGVRLPGSTQRLDLNPTSGVVPFFPAVADAHWSFDRAVGQEGFLALSRGRMLQSRDGEEAIGPWTPAVDLPTSELVGSSIAMPAMCGEHTLSYPMQLASIAIAGQDCWFVLSCACHTYLLRAKSDGVRVRDYGDLESMTARFLSLPGKKRYATNDDQRIVYKFARG